LRYAILLSGMSLRRHLNGLEFCYRTLVNRLGFVAENIRVLSYDGSLRAYADSEDPLPFLWPGDGTPFRMCVSGPGTRVAFQQALDVVSAKLTPDDEVFINTTGHGGHHGGESGPDLIVYPHCERYKRREFCADLATLPRHRALTVLMAQCFSGGFIRAVLAASPASATCIATATAEKHVSFADPVDGHWDSFQRNWLAALAGHDVDGRVIAGCDESLSVRAAFDYAAHPEVGNPYDSPQFAAWPAGAGELALRPMR
jgi:hypothetical protein